MYEKFIDWRPSGKSKPLIDHVNSILSLYEKQGYILTLRQLYYQLVAKDIIPNSVKSYKSLGDLVSQGRLAGLIDWERIEDRARIPMKNSHWDSPESIVRIAAESFYMEHWKDQEYYIEVWCEKDAVSNIITPVCRKYDVIFMANRGYSSQSAMYGAGLRFRLNQKKKRRIIYFGDHDPSGIDMVRDIEDRMNLFCNSIINVKRAALNMDQIEEYNPPENPAKTTDTRYQSYVEKYGEASWELDALTPEVLSGIVEKEIKMCLNKKKFDGVTEYQDEQKQRIEDLIKYL